MTKYDYKFKRMIVQEYLDGKGGYGSLQRKYNIKNREQVRSWVHCYCDFGFKGLKNSEKIKYILFN